jgi:hypothetical protein
MKKIIGYKLVKTEYADAVASIAGFKLMTLPDGINFEYGSAVYERLVDAKVLDLWFEPVYVEDDVIDDLIALCSRFGIKSWSVGVEEDGCYIKIYVVEDALDRFLELER